MGVVLQYASFDKALKKLLPPRKFQDARPFLCHGLPFSCKVFIVGIDPGTDIKFWPHWDSVEGCNKRGWLDEYLVKHGCFKPTRKRIEILFDILAPHRVLETNVFPFPRVARSRLTSTDTRMFDLLLETIRPRVLFVYGKDAVEHLEKLTGANLMLGKFTPVQYQGVKLDVISGRHLSGQGQAKGEVWTDAGVRKFAYVLLEHVNRKLS
jgi:hypothetical protein